MRRTLLPSLIGLTALTLTGCPEREVSEVFPNQATVEAKELGNARRAIDILFVIDDSKSMAEEQASLQRNFRSFISVLESVEGGVPDMHIGVVTSNLGDSRTQSADGRLQTGGIVFAGGVNYLADAPDENSADPNARVRNYDGDMAEVFTKMASVGTHGSGFEQHLAAARRALDAGNTANAGFLRPDAFLAIVIIADEDDCSMRAGNGLLNPTITQRGIASSMRCAQFGVICDGPDNMLGFGPRRNCRPRDNSQFITPVKDFVAGIRALKKDPDKQIIVASISAPAEPFTVIKNPATVFDGDGEPGTPYVSPSCTYEGGEGGKSQKAFPGVRLSSFVNSFRSSTETTICNQDLADGIRNIALLLRKRLGSRCFDAPLAEPFDCAVFDTNIETGKESLLAQCNGSNAPCWKIGVDTNVCKPPTTGQAILIDRGNGTAGASTMTRVDCVTLKK